MFSGTSMSSHSAQQREYFHKQLNFIQMITRVLTTQIRRSFYPRDFQICSLAVLVLSANPKLMWFQRMKIAKTMAVRRVYMTLALRLCEVYGTFNWLKNALNVIGGPVINTGKYRMYVKKFTKLYSATSWYYSCLSLRHSHVLEQSVHLLKCFSLDIYLNFKFAQYLSIPKEMILSMDIL